MGGEKAPILGEVAEDFSGEGGLGVTEAKEFVKVGCTGVVGKMGGNG